MRHPKMSAIGVKLTSLTNFPMSALDPKRTCACCLGREHLYNDLCDYAGCRAYSSVGIKARLFPYKAGYGIRTRQGRIG